MNCHNRCPENRCTCGPCGPVAPSTVACESLQSQIANFTTQFFGEVVKTEVNGEVQWTLPCDLDTGLPNNERAAGEGLACYFLRLFRDGIVGLTGPEGEPGAAGANGFNAYTVTLGGFIQPTLAAPNVTVLSFYNPAILPNLNVFIQSSGWYVVNAVDSTNGLLYLTLTKAVSGAAGVIPAGRLVVPAGYPGVSIQGPQGIQGPKGDTGASGTPLTTSNGFYYATSGSDFLLPLVSSPVNFVASSPQVTLPTAGTYIVTAVVGIIAKEFITTADVVALKLRNTSIGADVAGSAAEVSFLTNTERTQLTINIQVQTAGASQTIALYGSCTAANEAEVNLLTTTVSYVRIG